MFANTKKTPFKDLSLTSKIELLKADNIEAYNNVNKKWEEKGSINWMGYRIYRVVQPKPDTINWDHVHPDFKYMARDKSGSVFLFQHKPKTGNVAWAVSYGKCCNTKAHSSVVVGDIEWTNSLIERPKA